MVGVGIARIGRDPLMRPSRPVGSEVGVRVRPDLVNVVRTVSVLVVQVRMISVRRLDGVSARGDGGGGGRGGVAWGIRGGVVARAIVARAVGRGAVAWRPVGRASVEQRGERTRRGDLPDGGGCRGRLAGADRHERGDGRSGGEADAQAVVAGAWRSGERGTQRMAAGARDDAARGADGPAAGEQLELQHGAGGRAHEEPQRLPVNDGAADADLACAQRPRGLRDAAVGRGGAGAGVERGPQRPPRRAHRRIRRDAVTDRDAGVVTRRAGQVHATVVGGAEVEVLTRLQSVGDAPTGVGRIVLVEDPVVVVVALDDIEDPVVITVGRDRGAAGCGSAGRGAAGRGAAGRGAAGRGAAGLVAAGRGADEAGGGGDEAAARGQPFERALVAHREEERTVAGEAGEERVEVVGERALTAQQRARADSRGRLAQPSGERRHPRVQLARGGDELTVPVRPARDVVTPGAQAGERVGRAGGGGGGVAGGRAGDGRCRGEPADAAGEHDGC